MTIMPPPGGWVVRGPEYRPPQSRGGVVLVEWGGGVEGGREGEAGGVLRLARCGEEWPKKR